MPSRLLCKLGNNEEYGSLKMFDCDDVGTIRLEVRNESGEARNDWEYQYKLSKIRAKTAKARGEDFWN